jgi:hypothetical protein
METLTIISPDSGVESAMEKWNEFLSLEKHARCIILGEEIDKDGMAVLKILTRQTLGGVKRKILWIQNLELLKTVLEQSVQSFTSVHPSDLDDIALFSLAIDATPEEVTTRMFFLKHDLDPGNPNRNLLKLERVFTNL